METTSLSSRFAACAVFRALLILTVMSAALSLLVISVGHALTYSVLTYESQRTGDWDIYAFDPLHNRSINLTCSPGGDTDASWSPDGEKLAFVSWRAGTPNLFMLTITPPRVLQLDDQRMAVGFHPVWSPDSRQIVYEVERSGSIDLYRVDIDAPLSSVIALTNLPTDSRFPAWSPDGTQIAYVSWETGDAEIGVMLPDGTNSINLTQNRGWDVSPAWSADGHEIAFFSIRDGGYRDLYVMARDGSNQRPLSTSSAINSGAYWRAPIWSPDGTALLHGTTLPDGGYATVTQVDRSAAGRVIFTAALVSPELWLPDGAIFTTQQRDQWQIWLVGRDGERRMLTEGRFPVRWR